MSTSSNLLASFWEPLSADEHLIWGHRELARMQALKHEVFFDAVRQLSEQALAGSDAAARSALNAVEVALPEVWLKVLINEMSAGNYATQTLMDRVGFVMKHDFVAARDVVMPVLETLFRGGRSSGPWEQHAMKNAWGLKGAEGLFAPDAPVAVFLANAVHACHDESALLDLLERVGPYPDWPSRFVQQPHFVPNLPDWPKNTRDFNFHGSLIGQAVIANNPAALRALKRWDEPTYVQAIAKNVSKHKYGYGGNDNSRSAFSMAAISNCPDALAQLIADANEHMRRETSNPLVAQAMLDHLEQSGLKGDVKERAAHERQLATWRVLSEQLKAPLLDRVSELATEEAIALERKRHSVSASGYGHQAVPAKTEFSLVCEIAIKAVERVHPEAIADCHAAIDHPLALRMTTACSVEEISHPFDYAMSRLVYTNDLDTGVLDRVTMAFEEHIRARDMRWGGEDTLRKAAKQNNMLVATHLVGQGVDPEAKDDRGWTASSHFKVENKEQWRAFLSAVKAKNRMSDIAKLGKVSKL